MGNQFDLLISIAAQVPVVAIFIWFTLKLQDKTDKVMERRDAQWQKFLDDNQDRSIEAYKSVAEEIKKLSECITQQANLLTSHDIRVASLSARVEDFLGEYSVDRKIKMQPKGQGHYSG